MNRRVREVLATLLFLVPVSTLADAGAAFHAALAGAEQAADPLPRVRDYLPNLDAGLAYELQASHLRGREAGAVQGYKAALTTAAMQRRFGAPEPVFGVLVSNPRCDFPIRSQAFRRLAAEPEVAIRVGRAIDTAPGDVAALLPYLSHAAPAVELPNIGFDDLPAVNWIDLIATNAGAACFVVGEPVPIDTTLLSDLNVELRHNAAVLAAGNSREVMGHPLEAALWLVRMALRQGWKVEAGHVLLTGTIGGLHPLAPGRFEGDFGPLGKLAFEVR